MTPRTDTSRKYLLTGALAAAAVTMIACGSASPSGPEVVSGKLALSSFPAAVVSVRAVQKGHAPVDGRVQADGTFRIDLPKGNGYRIEFIRADGQALLVAPRHGGAIGSTFNVRGAGSFDLGAVRYIGDPVQQTFAFRLPSGSTASGNVQCQNGLTPAGKVCVDDNDEQHGGACVQCENGIDESGVCRPMLIVGDGVQCENGVDPNGQPCPDGPDTACASESASQTADGDSLQCQDGKDAVTGAACAQDNRSPAEGAVADHNLPQNVGCDGAEVGSGS